MGVASLSELTWTEIAAQAAASLLAVPVGSTEQHGPHLPLGTDTAIASELCRRLASQRGDVVIGPALYYTASGEHSGFPGTLSVGNRVLRDVLVEVGRSADAFGGVLFVSAHGGNVAALRSAVDVLIKESRLARSWSAPAPPGGDAHAGRVETSVMLALRPDLVRGIPPATDGCVVALGEVIGVLRRSGVRSVSANGVLGNPAASSAEVGEDILDFWEADLARSVAGWPAATSSAPLSETQDPTVRRL